MKFGSIPFPIWHRDAAIFKLGSGALLDFADVTSLDSSLLLLLLYRSILRPRPSAYEVSFALLGSNKE